MKLQMADIPLLCKVLFEVYNIATVVFVKPAGCCRQARTELMSLAQLMDDSDDVGIQGLIGSSLGTNRSDISS